MNRMPQTETPSPPHKWLYWFVGPALGIALVAAAIIENVGPGLAVLCILGGFGFTLLVPLVQFALIRTRPFRGRLAAAGAIGVALMIVSMGVAAASGAFNFW